MIENFILFVKHVILLNIYIYIYICTYQLLNIKNCNFRTNSLYKREEDFSLSRILRFRTTRLSEYLCFYFFRSSKYCLTFLESEMRSFVNQAQFVLRSYNSIVRSHKILSIEAIFSNVQYANNKFICITNFRFQDTWLWVCAWARLVCTRNCYCYHINLKLRYTPYQYFIETMEQKQCKMKGYYPANFPACFYCRDTFLNSISLL